MKPAVIRQVKSLSMACDTVGNVLLTKFSYLGAKESSVFLPASIVFWLLENVPANVNPQLRRPPASPEIGQADWQDESIPRVLSVQCKQFPDAVRMTLELNRKPDLVVLLDPSNLELLRRLMMLYRADLTDLDAG